MTAPNGRSATCWLIGGGVFLAAVASLQEWASRCLPTDGDRSESRAQITVLPSQMVAAQERRNGALMKYWASGYVRGVVVTVTATVGDGLTAGQAQAVLVAIANRQIEELDAA